MKKYLILAFAALALSCSKSDDNSPKKDDPIFDAPYTSLKNLNELPVGSLKYAGNKVGNLPVGLIDAKNSTCKRLDVLVIDEQKEVLKYSVFESKDNKDCNLIWDYPEQIVINPIVESGKMPSIVSVLSNRAATKEELEKDPDTKYYLEKKQVYKGDLEVGFQAGYLRIEDKISNTTQGSQNKGKSYLYFHTK